MEESQIQNGELNTLVQSIIESPAIEVRRLLITENGSHSGSIAIAFALCDYLDPASISKIVNLHKPRGAFPSICFKGASDYYREGDFREIIRQLPHNHPNTYNKYLAWQRFFSYLINKHLTTQRQIQKNQSSLKIKQSFEVFNKNYQQINLITFISAPTQYQINQILNIFLWQKNQKPYNGIQLYFTNVEDSSCLFQNYRDFEVYRVDFMRGPPYHVHHRPLAQFYESIRGVIRQNPIDEELAAISRSSAFIQSSFGIVIFNKQKLSVSANAIIAEIKNVLRDNNWIFQEYNDENDPHSDLLAYKKQQYPTLNILRDYLATNNMLLTKFIEIYHDNDPMRRLKTLQLINKVSGFDIKQKRKKLTLLFSLNRIDLLQIISRFWQQQQLTRQSQTLSRIFLSCCLNNITNQLYLYPQSDFNYLKDEQAFTSYHLSSSTLDRHFFTNQKIVICSYLQQPIEHFIDRIISNYFFFYLVTFNFGGRFAVYSSYYQSVFGESEGKIVFCSLANLKQDIRQYGESKSKCSIQIGLIYQTSMQQDIKPNIAKLRQDFEANRFVTYEYPAKSLQLRNQAHLTLQNTGAALVQIYYRLIIIYRGKQGQKPREFTSADKFDDLDSDSESQSEERKMRKGAERSIQNHKSQIWCQFSKQNQSSPKKKQKQQVTWQMVFNLLRQKYQKDTLFQQLFSSKIRDNQNKLLNCFQFLNDVQPKLINQILVLKYQRGQIKQKPSRHYCILNFNYYYFYPYKHLAIKKIKNQKNSQNLINFSSQRYQYKLELSKFFDQFNPINNNFDELMDVVKSLFYQVLKRCLQELALLNPTINSMQAILQSLIYYNYDYIKLNSLEYSSLAGHDTNCSQSQLKDLVYSGAKQFLHRRLKDYTYFNYYVEIINIQKQSKQQSNTIILIHIITPKEIKEAHHDYSAEFIAQLKKSSIKNNYSLCEEHIRNRITKAFIAHKIDSKELIQQISQDIALYVEENYQAKEGIQSTPISKRSKFTLAQLMDKLNKDD